MNSRLHSVAQVSKHASEHTSKHALLHAAAPDQHQPVHTLPKSQPALGHIPPSAAVAQSHHRAGILTKTVFFVGFMGAGKSSVARRVARSAKVTSIDLDTYIERREGRRIKDVFESEGEQAFRKLEAEVLQMLATREPALISCGGGVVMREENRRLLRSQGFVIHLVVAADEAKARISDAASRPLFKDIEQARNLSLMRMPLYNEIADINIETSGKTVAGIARVVQSVLVKEGVLCLPSR